MLRALPAIHQEVVEETILQKVASSNMISGSNLLPEIFVFNRIYLAMNKLQLLVFIYCQLGDNSYSTNFYNKLSRIATQFKNDIADEENCRLLSRSAGQVENEIDDIISEKRLSLDQDEISKLKQLRTEATAQNFIAAVGHTSYSLYPTKAEFSLANNRVGANVTLTSSGKFCVNTLNVCR